MSRSHVMTVMSDVIVVVVQVSGRWLSRGVNRGRKTHER